MNRKESLSPRYIALGSSRGLGAGLGPQAPEECPSCGNRGEHQLCCPQGVRESAVFQVRPATRLLVWRRAFLAGEMCLSPEEECRQLAALYRQANRDQPGRGFDELARHWWLVADQVAQLPGGADRPGWRTLWEVYGACLAQGGRG